MDDTYKYVPGSDPLMEEEFEEEEYCEEEEYDLDTEEDDDFLEEWDEYMDDDID